MTRSLYVLDGHYQIYRAYHAPFARLTAPSGEPTKAIHAFCGMLFNLIRERKPDHLVMVMDTSDETVFRRDIDPQYKANREPPPEDFTPQLERIVAIVCAMNIPILTAPGFEADDLMATIAEHQASPDLDVFLVSKDKDLEQLITDHVYMYDVSKGGVIDGDYVREKKGYSPDQAIDVQTLMGDNTDNIPGIYGVGIKKAAALVNQFGSAQAVLDNADALTPKLKERVRAFTDQIDVTRKLVTLRRDVPMTFDLDATRFEGISADAVEPLFEELALNRLTDQLRTLANPDAEKPAARTPGTLFDDVPPDSADRQNSDTPPGEYHIIRSEKELSDFVDDLRGQDRFAFDTETTSLNPVDADLVGISIAWQAGHGYYIPVRGLGETLPHETVVAALKPIFEDPLVKKAGHNLKFDIGILHQAGIKTQGVWFDTLLASFVLQSDRPSHGLKALTLELFGYQMTPITELIGRGKNQITIDRVDVDRVGRYAAEDADFTWRLVEYFEPRLASSPMQSLFDSIEMPLVEVLATMERNGVAIDTDALARMSTSMAKRIDELRGEIHDAAGHPFNVDSTKQLAVVLFDEMGLEVVRKTKTGRSTDADTLTTLAAASDCVIPRLVLEYRELTKLKNTYIDTLPTMVSRRTGRIHASFHQTGAQTGRLSSSDPNLQNIPVRTEAGREIRRAFVAGEPGHVLLTADYSQIELRVLAHFSKDETLSEAFRQDQDIHAFVAAQVNSIPIDQVTKQQRSAAKAVNFGIVYGQTPFGLARGLGISQTEAKAFIDTYFLRYPGIRFFIDRCIEEVRARGYAETIAGRRRNVDGLRSRNRQQVALAERIAVNTVIQGSAADMIKKAMIDIDQAITSENRPLKMLIQVHDELVFETPEDAVAQEAEMIRKKMECAIPLDVPISVDINWAQNWLEGK
jgi:DNA polymerase I